MPCAFHCSPESEHTIREPHDRRHIPTGSACSKHPCALNPFVADNLTLSLPITTLKDYAVYVIKTV